MTAQDLKNAILQLAVQGKLVPQDTHDEPASELLKRIEVEKAALIKAGRIKKYKTLTALSADDLPFDIPESWCWLKLGSICQLLDGEKKKGISFPYLEAKFLRGKAVATMINEGKYVPKGTRLILVDGENSGEVFSATEDGYMGSTFKVLFFPQELFAGYVLYFLQFKQLAFRNNKTGSAIPHLNKELFFNMPFPVPPLAEQKRIVEKIEELMPLVEEYRKAEERLTALNAEFPDKLRKSILQQAIQGKLTERDPADEPASNLLKRIRAEKERLIREGTIKKEKPLPPIAEEEIPFEIPDGWTWASSMQSVRLAPKSSPKGRIAVLRMGNLQNGRIDYSNLVYSSNEYDIERCHLDYNDLLFNRTNSKELVGKTAIYKAEIPAIYAGYLIRVTPVVLNADFLNYVMQSQHFKDYCLAVKTDAIGQSNINAEKLKRFVFPLPPLAEQQRIVDRVNELLAVCDELK